jgi:hypothetical protein
MNVSLSDATAIGVNALVGALLAGLYSLGVLYSERRAGALLSVKTHALHVDRIVLSYCRELERRTKHLAIIPFLQVIDAVDRIVGLRIQLQERKEPAKKEDEKETFFQLARLRRCMKELVQTCKPHMSVAEIVDLENICSKLIDQGLESHIKTITLLTKYAR